MKFSKSFVFVAIFTLCCQAIAQRIARPNCRKNNDGYAPLHLAAMDGDETEAKKLIDLKCNVDVTDPEMKTPLHWSGENGTTNVALLLINNGANIKAKTVKGVTPLHIAARTGNTEIAQLLLEKGADVNAADTYIKYTPLHWASEKCHFNVTKLLTQNGADITRINRNGKTPEQLVEDHCKENPHVDGIDATALNITIIDSVHSTFENDLKKLLDERNNVLAKSEFKVFADITAEAVKAFLPFLDKATLLMTKLHSHYASQSWTDLFLRTVEEAKREDVNSNIKLVRSHLNSIEIDSKNLMKEILNGSSTEASALAGYVMRELRQYLFEFALEDSNYRKYPMITIGPLFLMATMISAMGTIYHEQFSDIACRMHYTLIEYRDLSVDDRLKRINIHYQYRNTIRTADELTPQRIASIEHEPYRRDGYNGANAYIINCKNDSQQYAEVLPGLPGLLHAPVYEYLKDTMGANTFYTSRTGKSFSTDCTESYLRYIRYRVETYFAKQIDSVAVICPEKIKTNLKAVTESGYLTVTIEKAHWISTDDGTGCNRPWGFCNLYVKVSFDGSEPEKTKTKTCNGRIDYDRHVYPAVFYKQFKSGRILGNAPVKIEIWSKPSPFSIQFGDILLRTWNTNAKELLKNGRMTKDKDNWIETRSEWKDAAVAINR